MIGSLDREVRDHIPAPVPEASKKGSPPRPGALKRSVPFATVAARTRLDPHAPCGFPRRLRKGPGSAWGQEGFGGGSQAARVSEPEVAGPHRYSGVVSQARSAPPSQASASPSTRRSSQ